MEKATTCVQAKGYSIEQALLVGILLEKPPQKTVLQKFDGSRILMEVSPAGPKVLAPLVMLCTCSSGLTAAAVLEMRDWTSNTPSRSSVSKSS